MTYYMAGEGRRLFGQTKPSELPNKFAMSVRAIHRLGAADHAMEWSQGDSLVEDHACAHSGETLWRIKRHRISRCRGTTKTWCRCSRRGTFAGSREFVSVKADRRFGSAITGTASWCRVAAYRLDGSRRVIRRRVRGVQKHLQPRNGRKKIIIVMDDAKLDLAWRARLGRSGTTRGKDPGG